MEKRTPQTPDISAPQQLDEVHVISLSGGAWKGAVQYWVLVYLLNAYTISLISGVSVGSINGVMGAMGKLDELLAFWKAIKSLRGYLSLRWLYLICYFLGLTHLWEWATKKPILGGVFAMDGLRAKLQTDAHLSEIQIPFVAGVVSHNSGRYYNLDTRDMEKDEELHNACLASSCMAPFMTPPWIDLKETDPETGKRVMSVGFDGGGKNIFPVPTEAIAAYRAQGKRVIVHAVGCMPLERIQWKPSIKISGLVELALRGIEVLEDEIYNDDLMHDLRAAVGPEGEVRVWLPCEHPGGSFEANPDIIQKRLDIGRKTAEAGPTYVLKGI